MPTTSNFGWTTPADTDLVKDGAAAIRTLGNGIDTSLIDLKGGTTGQVLSKASNTDLDYSWVTPNVGDITEVQAGTGISVASGTGPIPVITNTVATAYDAKGDLIVGTGADTFSRLAVGGTNGHTLQVDSSTATGLKWGAAAAGGYTELATNTPSGATTVSFTSISSSYKHLLVTWTGLYNSSHGGFGWGARLNNDSGSNYAMGGLKINYLAPNNVVQTAVYTADSMFSGDYVMTPISNASDSTWNKVCTGYFLIYDYANTSYNKYVQWGAWSWNNSDSGMNAPITIHGIYNSTSAIDRFDFIRTSTQTLTGGIIRLYGVS